MVYTIPNDDTEGVDLLAQMGRKRKEVDFDKIDAMCKYHCTAEEIIDHLNIFDHDVSYDTVARRIKEVHGITFAEYIRKRQHGFAKPRLRQLQWKAAEAGNVTMLIWLGKQYLGQLDKSETELSSGEKEITVRIID